MKLINQLQILSIFLLLFSCGSDNDTEETPNSGEPIFFQQTIVSSPTINGQNISFSENLTDFRTIIHNIDATSIPSQTFAPIQFTVAVPIDATSTVTQSTSSAFYSTDNLDNGNIPLSNSQIGSRQTDSNGIERQLYTFTFDASNTEIPLSATNIFSLDFNIAFDYIYNDEFGDQSNYELELRYVMSFENSDQVGGDVLFWAEEGHACGGINITISNGTTINISANTTGGEPSCDTVGNPGKIEDLPAGTYSYTASCTNQDWNGTFTIMDGNCTIIELEDQIARSEILFYYPGFEYPAPECENEMRITLRRAENNSVVNTRTLTSLYGNVTPNDCNAEPVGGLFEYLLPGQYYAEFSCPTGNYGFTTNIITLQPDTCLLYNLNP